MKFQEVPVSTVSQTPATDLSGTVREGNLIFLDARSRLVCQIEAARKQLDDLEAHTDSVLRQFI